MGMQCAVGEDDLIAIVLPHFVTFGLFTCDAHKGWNTSRG